MKETFLDFLSLLGFCIISPFVLGFLIIFCTLCDLKEGMLFYKPEKGCKECGGEMVEEGYSGYKCKNCNWKFKYLSFGD